MRAGRALRAVRWKRGLRLQDLSVLAGVSPSALSRMERGRLDGIALRTLRKAASALELRLDVSVRSVGGDVARLLDEAHAALGEAVTRWLVAAGRGGTAGGVVLALGRARSD